MTSAIYPVCLSYIVFVNWLFAVRSWSINVQTPAFRLYSRLYSYSPQQLHVTDEMNGEIESVSNVSTEDAMLYQDNFSIPAQKWLNNSTSSSLASSMSQLKCINVPVPSFVAPSKTVGITYLHWPSKQQRQNTSFRNQPKKPVIVLLHGFDCSCLEFRCLGPLLSNAGYDVYAPDILGWGFTQLEQVSNFSADAKIEALESFLRAVLLPKSAAEEDFNGQKLRMYNNCTSLNISSKTSSSFALLTEKQKPTVKICMIGASLGAAAAVELCSRFCSPSIKEQDIQIDSMVWISAQVFLDGNMLRSVPIWWAKLLIPLLRVKQFRKIVDMLSVHDTKHYNDSVHEGDLALEAWNTQSSRNGWKEAMLSFFVEGGFNPSTKLNNCKENVSTHLVLSGSNDGILGDTFARKLHTTLGNNSKLVWIDNCGHFPHIEHPHATANAILEFLQTIN